MKSLFLIIVLLSLGAGSLKSQHLGSTKGQSSLGLGLGLPYGGLGLKVGYNTSDQVTLFGGLGYNMAGIGANAGLKLILPSEKQSEFYFTGMYGYNSVIIMPRGIMNGIFAGPSFGPGLKINSLSNKGAFWDIGLLVPVRSQKYKDAILEIERSPYTTIESKPWPVLFYVGLNYPLSGE